MPNLGRETGGYRFFKEEDHPRDDDGKFTDKGGGGGGTKTTESTVESLDDRLPENQRKSVRESVTSTVSKPAPRELGDTIQIDHEVYPEYAKTLSDEELRYTIKDAGEALAANPEGEKAGYYADEIHYAAMELKRRQEERGTTEPGKIEHPAYRDVEPVPEGGLDWIKGGGGSVRVTSYDELDPGSTIHIKGMGDYGVQDVTEDDFTLVDESEPSMNQTVSRDAFEEHMESGHYTVSRIPTSEEIDQDERVRGLK